MYTIKTLNAISPVGLAKLNKNLFDVAVDADAPDGILVRSADLLNTTFNDNLLAIARAGAGVNNIPLDRCSEQGIVVFNTPGANANAVAELVIGMLIAGSRNVADAAQWCQGLAGDPAMAKTVEKGKKKFVGNEIKGKTLGVIGLGAIGSRVTEGGITSGGFTNTQEFSPVPGHPDVLVDQSSGFLFPRVGEGIWAYTGRPFLASSSQGVVVTTDWRRNRIQVIAGPLADALKPQGDPQPPDSAAMIDETNRMRSEANLPSLVGDARLAAAAHNHAVYMQLNQYLDHNEDSGKPGFTGGEPWERCVAVGFPFQCGEIANYAGDFGSRMSVQVWIATAFHRDMLTSPGVGPIGGGFVTPGGWSVMNAPSDSRHYLGDAIGYPRGTYTGPLWYSGEIPDPAASCADGSISAPYGTAISLNLPDNGLKWPDSITLRDGVGTTVRGCLLREDHGSSAAVFQPDDPLKPWTTYSVTASWTGRRDDLTWTFATTAGPAGLDTVPPGTKNPSRRSRAKHFKVILKPRSERRLRIDVNPDLGKKTYRGALQKGRKSHWRTVKRVRLSGKRHVRIIHARRPGAYRIVIPGQHGYKKGASRIVRLK